MTTEARLPSETKSNLGLRPKILGFYTQGKSAVQMAKILGISKQAIYRHLKVLSEQPGSHVIYKSGVEREDTKWYKIIERTLNELPFYHRQGLVPTARKMGYRLIELARGIREINPDITTDELLSKHGLPDLGDPEGPTSFPKI